MTRVRKATAVALMTPLAISAVAIGVSVPADAASLCLPLAKASINAPDDSHRAGSTVPISAHVSGLSLGAHLRISGPGLDRQVGPTVLNGSINGVATVEKAGHFALTVVSGGCTYATSGFSVQPAASSALAPSHHSSTAKPRVSGSSGGSGSRSRKVHSGHAPGALPGGGGLGAGGKVPEPLNDKSPYNLPNVAPNGSAPGVQFPTTDPEVASPTVAKPMARDMAAPSPVNWGQSIAIALVLLLMSAHLGMWSRRQRRLSAQGAGGLLAGGARTSSTRPAGKSAAGRIGDSRNASSNGIAEEPKRRERSSRRAYQGRRRRD